MERIDWKRFYGTKEWKIIRSGLIGTKCAWCGTKETLYLDHMVPFSDFFNEVYDKLKEKSKYKNDFHLVFLINRYYPEFELLLKSIKTGETGIVVGLTPKTSMYTVIWMPSEMKQKIRKDQLEEKIGSIFLKQEPDTKKMEEVLVEHEKIKDESYEKAAGRYANPAKEEVQTLCKRCHYANGRGLKKCPKCDGFTTQWREQCFKCEHGMSYQEYLIKQEEEK